MYLIMYLNFINASRSNIKQSVCTKLFFLISARLVPMKTYTILSQLTIVPRCQWGVTLSRIGDRHKCANFENGLSELRSCCVPRVRITSGNRQAREATEPFYSDTVWVQPFYIFEHCLRYNAHVVHRVLSASCVVAMQRRIWPINKRAVRNRSFDWASWILRHTYVSFRRNRM